MKIARFILTCALLLPGLLNAQVSKEREVVANGGDYSSAPALALSWTVGEPAVADYQTTNWIVTEGFQQADDNPVGVWEPTFPGKIVVYPNPVQDQLSFDIETPKPMKVDIQVYDVTGKLVRQVPQFSVNRYHQGSIDLTQLPSGKWLIRFIDTQSQTQKTFRVTKVY